jgi:hypothetical protein
MSGYKAKPKFGGRIPASWSDDSDGQSLLGGLSFFTGRGLISKLVRKIINKRKRKRFKEMKPDRPPKDSYIVDTG